MKTKKLTSLSILLGISLVIFILESQLPPLVPIPGVKPGLANIITLFIMVRFGKREAFAVLLLRITLGSIFTGTVTAFLYSLSGGAAGFIFMSAAYSLLREPRPLWAVSVFGALGHNAGQIAAAVFVTGLWQIAAYFPALIISGIVTGVFTGAAASAALRAAPSAKQ